MLKEFVQLRKPVYQGPILAVWGSDYRFMNASVMYSNMGRVHAEVNANTAKYDSPSFSGLVAVPTALLPVVC